MTIAWWWKSATTDREFLLKWKPASSSRSLPPREWVKAQGSVLIRFNASSRSTTAMWMKSHVPETPAFKYGCRWQKCRAQPVETERAEEVDSYRQYYFLRNVPFLSSLKASGSCS